MKLTQSDFLAAAIVLCLVTPASAAPPITEYPIPTANSIPQGITAKPDGALWFTEYIGSKIGRALPAPFSTGANSYTITTVAGNGSSIGPPGDNGPATAAALTPLGLAVDRFGNLYIIDRGSANLAGPRPSTPRMVDTAGIITTLGCNGGPVLGVPPTPNSAPAMEVSCGNLAGVAIDNFLNIYVTQGGGRTLDWLAPSGIISIISFDVNGPANAVVDGAGNAYVADAGNCRIVKTNTSGALTIVAGIGGSCGYSGDNGFATGAQLADPQGVAVDSAGNLYIADTNNFWVRKVDTSGIITTVAGTGVRGFSGDGGPATSAQITGATGVATDSAGNLYIADFDNGRIRRVDTSGIITTIAGGGTNGLGDGGPATSAHLQFPFDVVVDAAGKLYVADAGDFRVRLLTPVSEGIGLVYKPLEPCRIMDTRYATAGSGVQGPITGGVLKQIPGFITAGSDWGQYGQTGTPSDCGLTNPPGNAIQAVAIVITILNPNFDAFLGVGDVNDLTTILSTVALNYTTGQGLSTMYIVPQTTNNTIYFALPTDLSAQLIFDVVGYMVTSDATALQCTTETSVASTISASGGTGSATSPPCSASYTLTSGSCDSDSFSMNLVQDETSGQAWFCSAVNSGGSAAHLKSTANCCQVGGK